MRWHARTIVPVGLGVGLVLAGMAAAALWTHRVPGTSRAGPARVVSGAEEPATRVASADVEALKAEVDRLKERAPRVTPQELEALTAEVKRMHAGQEAWELRSAAMSRELAALRAQLPGVDRDPAATGRKVHQRARADPTGDRAAEGPAPAPDEVPVEDESARAEAETQAQLEAFEGALVEEDVDPAWAGAAQQALQEALHREAAAGLRLVQVDCRTSLCRLELVLDGAGALGESLEQLLYLAHWEGAGFAQIDEASGTAVVYLSREGYAFPQASE